MYRTSSSSLLGSRLFVFTLVASLQGGCAVNPARSVNRCGPAKLDASAPTEVLQDYEAALNRGDVGAVVSLYASDGVFMAQHREPSIGRASIQAAYREIFGAIKLDVRFEIDELELLTDTTAWARTRSEGTVTFVDGGAKIEEGNQELFILVRDDECSDWQIGRYIFSTTRPRG